MQILPEKYQVKLISGNPQYERLPDGKRLLLKPIVIEWNGEQIVLPKGKITDFSSYPRAFILWGFPVLLAIIFNSIDFLWYWLVPFLWPAWYKTDTTGTIHDIIWQCLWKTIGFLKSNLIWACGALTGAVWRLRVTPIQALAGTIGLSTFGFFVYLKKRLDDNFPKK